MGVQYVKCSIYRNETLKNEITGKPLIPGVDYNSKNPIAGKPSVKIIVDNYSIKIQEYSGVKVDYGTNGIMFKNETTAYGEKFLNTVLTGDIIELKDSKRKFVIKGQPTKGLKYMVMKINEI